MLYIIIIIIVCIFIIYVILDNYKIDIKYNVVQIDNLPKEFINYTILQLTDLHSKEFGKVLYNKINSVYYDMIVFTGDMMNNKDCEIKSFKNIIENLERKTLMIYVDGNNGPKTFDEKTDIITDFGRNIQSLGCTLLYNTYCLEKNNSKIWLSNFDVVTNMLYYKEFSNEKLNKKLSVIDNNVSVGIGHKPANKDILQCIADKSIPCYNYDLIIVGHYHGGQIRIPLYGALYVSARKITESFLPDQNMVSGLYKYKNIYQYVSTGLGATNSIPILNFRLFNRPQIDIIKLVRK